MNIPFYEVFVDGKSRKIEVTSDGKNRFTAKVDDKPIKIEMSGERFEDGKVFSMRLDGKNYSVEMPRIEWGKALSLNVEGTVFKAELKTRERKNTLTTFEPIAVSPEKRSGISKHIREGAIFAPMTGKVVSVKVKQGDEVKAGQTLCVIEAMKMENEIVATKPGIVKGVLISEGSPVIEGEALFLLS